MLRCVAVLYPLALILVLGAMRFVGERWWLTTVLLYLPRIGFLLPVPVVVFGVWYTGPRWLFLAECALLLAVLFPLTGLELSWPKTRREPAVRVFSCNIYSGALGLERVLASIQELKPDVIVLQEATGLSDYFKAHLPGYAIEHSAQFLLATRYPVKDTYFPPKLLAGGTLRSPRFVGYTLETPLGLIDLYDIHPISPREGFHAVRGTGLSHEILSGRIFKPAGAATVVANAELRRLQVQAFAEHARQSPRPVILAGDTNLPDQSWVFEHYLGGFQDGFARVGRGFGYTFPVNNRKPAWMRIDRILASDAFEFLAFFRVDKQASDHVCIAADIARSRAR
jgi:endonuclease/exonuclease/phosphatase (EEP) superfamily protein YafD